MCGAAYECGNRVSGERMTDVCLVVAVSKEPTGWPVFSDSLLIFCCLLSTLLASANLAMPADSGTG